MPHKNITPFERNGILGLLMSLRLFKYPRPIRFLIYQRLRQRLLGYTRAHYYHCIAEATRLAQALSKPCLSIIEFGVAGGNGLVEIERICARLTRIHGMEYRIFGFDSGVGLPPPRDFRDLPYQWQKGFFSMDQSALNAKLKSAELVLGDVAETVPDFLRRSDVPPIGSLLFDLDYYSSTKAAFAIFDSPSSDHYLPRIQCYFDDLATIESVGVRKAISEFNAAGETRKIEHPLHFSHMREYVDFGWKLFEYHDFKHPEYMTQIVQDDQLPLNN